MLLRESRPVAACNDVPSGRPWLGLTWEPVEGAMRLGQKEKANRPVEN